MESIYTQSFTLTDLHVDCHRKLKPSALLYFVQEISGIHAAQLGAAWEDLSKKNLFWAIIRHRVEITRMPESGETITLETWPMPTTRVAYPRATVAYDAQGNLLFKTVAIWVLMDHTTRAMVLPGKSGVGVPGILRDTECSLPVSIPVKKSENQTSRTVGYSELDRNGHMNNTFYMNWADDLLGSAFHSAHELRSFNICYLSEAKEGQTVDLSWEISVENVLSVEGETTDQAAHRVFAVSAEYT